MRKLLASAALTVTAYAACPAFAATDAECQALWTKADVNKDGVLSDAEAMRYAAAMRVREAKMPSDGKLTHAGQVGREQTVATAAKAAEGCALNTLANIKAELGSLDRVVRIVLVNGFVNAVDGFTESPAVINGASDLFVRVFGDAGRHARAAVAVNGLPRGATAEIQAVVEIRD